MKIPILIILDQCDVKHLDEDTDSDNTRSVRCETPYEDTDSDNTRSVRCETPYEDTDSDNTRSV